jgi:uncharacterized protein YdeI (BOF family)
MKNYLSTIALILLLSLTFVGCSDDDDNDNDDGGNTPVDTKSYYPLNDGHYRVYNNYDISSDSGSETFTSFDSLVVTDASNNLSVEVTTYNSNNEEVWNQTKVDKYRNDDNKTLIGGDAFYRQLQDIFGEDTDNIFAGQEMYTMIDQAENSWTVFSDNSLSMDILIETPFGSLTFTINEVNISAVNSGTENIDLGDEVFNGDALKVTTTTIIKGKLNGNDVTLTSNVEKWYGENIGTVKTNILASEVESPDETIKTLVSTIIPQPTRSEIIRYSVIDSQ